LDLDGSFVDLVSRFADETGTVALLSGGAHDSARWNILGIRPWLTLGESAGQVALDIGGRRTVLPGDPFDALDVVSRRYTLPGPDVDHPLSAGLLGYLAYDLKDVLEDLPRTSRDDLGLPRLWMSAPSILLVQDRRDGTTTVHVPVRSGERAAKDVLAEFVASLSSPPVARSGTFNAGPLVSGLSREEYMGSVEAIREYIARGHVYQVNLSQRFEARFEGDAFALFARLFEANPAPFFAYVQAGDHQIVSTSPERFVELRGSKVETRPIKGTRPRGRTPQEDVLLRRDLEESPKDDSELSMIVDLLRNDIGKVCAAGSVRVVEHKRVEAYENVHHLVSVVEGRLDEGRSAADLLRATFPGGSITGCPKIRSMEVIDELEPVRRHVYTGSIGYLGFGGTMDLNIAIRTATITAGRLVYSVGGGVVYDSDPADEFEETLHKGRTISNVLSGPDGGSTGSTDTRIGWMDGKFLPMAAMTVSVEEEGFAYGCGFFETIRVEGGRPLRLESHLERFAKTWEFLFGGDFPHITWKDVIDRLVERNDLMDRVAAVKILASAGKPGSGPRGIRLMATIRPYTHRLEMIGREGLRLATYPHGRQTPLADHKTMNYLLQRTAADWVKRHDADEAILLNADGTVSETNTANLFCRIDGRWVRPASGHVLPGTMEKALLELLAARGEAVETRSLSLEELRGARDVLVCNALMGVVPAISVDGHGVASDPVLCAHLQRELLG
jgi:para-aminobenzoate synthetase component 1